MRGVRISCALLASILLCFCLNVPATEGDFYDQFLEVVESGQHGFIADTRVVDTYSPFPIPTNTPVSLSILRTRGELCGVRLGMSMSDVVQAWGKPNALYTPCGSETRLWYAGLGGDIMSAITLIVRSNKLAVIAMGSEKLKIIRFEEEGLAKLRDKKAIRLELGPPLEYPPNRRLFDGAMVYCDGNIRTDFLFLNHLNSVLEGSQEVLAMITVRFADSVTNSWKTDSQSPTNGNLPIREETKRPSSPDGASR